MMEIVVQNIALGFGLSLVLFFTGQCCRCFCEIIDTAIGR